MRIVLAYILVVPLVQFCLTIGVLVGGFVVALLLAWAPLRLRTLIAGVCAGTGGVALAVAWGYGVFRLLVGPGSFTIWPFLASTVPLLLPIFNDLRHAKRTATARDALLEVAANRGADVAADMARQTQTPHTSAVIGEIVGLLLATVWFVGFR